LLNASAFEGMMVGTSAALRLAFLMLAATAGYTVTTYSAGAAVADTAAEVAFCHYAASPISLGHLMMFSIASLMSLQSRRRAWSYVRLSSISILTVANEFDSVIVVVSLTFIFISP
jgi:hypothetical protein